MTVDNTGEFASLIRGAPSRGLISTDEQMAKLNRSATFFSLFFLFLELAHSRKDSHRVAILALGAKNRRSPRTKTCFKGYTQMNYLGI